MLRLFAIFFMLTTLAWPAHAANAPLVAGDFCFPVQPIFSKGPDQVICETLPDRNGNTSTIPSSKEEGFTLDTPFMGKGWFRDGFVCADEDPECTLKYHLAEDWNISGDDDKGDPIFAVANGYVWYVKPRSGGESDSWGKVIIIEHVLPSGKSYWSVYAHMQDVLVDPDCGPTTTPWAPNCIVRKGQWIGTIGDADGFYTRNGSGFHLHFELRSKKPSSTSPMINPWLVDPHDPAYRSIVSQYTKPIEFIRDHGKNIPACVFPPYLCTTAELWCERGGGVEGPSVITENPTELSATTVTLRGTVNPNGLSTQAYFLWDDDKNLDFETPHTTVGSGNDDNRFSASIPIICGGRTYYVKAVGVNAQGENLGGTFSFVSGPCIGTNPPPPFSITSASLESDPNVAGRVSKLVFERFATGNGTQLFYDLYRNGTLIYTLQAAQYNGISSIYDRKGGLYTGETYTYRIVARDGIGTISSTNTITVFVPAGEGPAIGTPAITTALPDGITANGGYLAADITGNGQPTDVVFEWGANSIYGTITDAVELLEPTHVSQRVRTGLFGLSCDPGIYHYRAVARRDGAPVAYGADQTLTLDCAANTPVTDGKQLPEVATVGLWRMDGAVRTERKTRSEEGTESRRLIVTGYPQSVAGFNGEANGAYRTIRANGESLITDTAPPEDKDFTWMGWVKLNNPATDHQLLYLYQPAPAGQKQALLLITQEHAVLSFQNPPAQGAVVWSNSTLPAGVWKHVAFTREAGMYRIYLNGAVDAAYSAGSNLDVTTLSTTSTTSCDCDLDEVQLIYGRAWSGQEISDYYISASSFVIQTPVQSSQPPGAAGSLDVRRQDAQFAYIPDYAQHGLDLTGDFTLEAWVKLRTPIPGLSSYTLISKWGAMPSGRSYNFEYYHNGTSPVLRLTTDSGGGHDAGVEIPYTLPLGTWHHIAVSYSAATGRAEFFGDCTSLGTVSGLTTSVQDGDGSFFIGSRFGYPSLTFDGLMDDVRVWSLKRFAAEIANNCTVTVPSSAQGLVSNWRFDHTPDDETSSSNTLALYNGANFLTDVFLPNIRPAFSFMEPNGSGDQADGSFLITWSDGDPDSSANISLSYSTSPACSSLVPIASNISEDDTTNSYAWDTSTVSAGTYYLKAVIDDGVTPSVSVCSALPIVIAHPPTVIRALAQGTPGVVGKDIWTTSIYSFAPGGSTPGGGLDDHTLVAGGWGDSYYSLLQFDLAGLPQHATSARLELFCFRSRSGVTAALFLHRITQDWDWRVQGSGRDWERLWWADRPPTVSLSSTQLPAPAVGQWYSVDITALYNAWKAGTYPNYGVQLRPVSTSNRWSEFYSSNYSDSVLRPRLVIER